MPYAVCRMMYVWRLKSDKYEEMLFPIMDGLSAYKKERRCAARYRAILTRVLCHAKNTEKANTSDSML